MSVQDRMMIFNQNENIRFVKNKNENEFSWSGEYIGDITNLVNQIPAIKGNKLFFLYPADQYIIIKKYEPIVHIIEIIKRIYDFKIIPYNICTYKKKKYIMYLYVPFHEIEYTLNKKKQNEITEDERRIYFLYWILGIKGKILKIFIHDPSNQYNNQIIVSNGKYSSIDYEKNKMTKGCMNKMFKNYQELYNTSLFFKNNEKIDLIRSLMSNENYWWFQEIEKRIEQIVVSSSYN